MKDIPIKATAPRHATVDMCQETTNPQPYFIELAGRWPNGIFERHQFAPSGSRFREHPFVHRLIGDGGDVYRSIAEYPVAERTIEHRCPIGVFDIDCESNLEEARRQAIACVHTLSRKLDVPTHDIWVTFSGSKGFHILLSRDLFGDTADKATIWVWREVAAELKQNVADSVDMSIYRQGALIRCPNTLNTKSGRFDVPLEAAELEGMHSEDIRFLAKKSRPENPWTTPDITVTARAWLFNHIAKITEKNQGQKTNLPNVGGCHRRGWHTPPCVRRAEQMELPDGCRHDSLHSLARFYFSVGMAADEIVDRLIEIDTRHPIRDPDYIPRMVESVVRNPGFYGCPNPGLETLCAPDKCPLKRMGERSD